MEQAEATPEVYALRIETGEFTPLGMQVLTGLSPANQRQIRARAGFASRVSEDGKRRNHYTPFEAAKFLAVHFMMKMGTPAAETIDYSDEAAISILFHSLGGRGGALLGAGPEDPDALEDFFYHEVMWNLLDDWVKEATGDTIDRDHFVPGEALIRTDESGWRFVADMEGVLDEEPAAIACIDFIVIGRMLTEEEPLVRVIEHDADPDTLLWKMADPLGPDIVANIFAQLNHKMAEMNERIDNATGRGPKH